MQIAIGELGDILMGDDGVSPYCLEVLEGALEFSQSVQPVKRDSSSTDIWWSRSGA